MTYKRNPDHKSTASVTHSGRGLIGAIHQELTGEPLPKSDLCAQCLANANWNEAGGYHAAAEECREYCRRGHRNA